MSKNLICSAYLILLSAVILTCGSSDNDSSADVFFILPEEPYYEEPINPAAGDFSQSSKTLVSKMKYGWNLGNTFDAHSDSNLSVDYETYWGQPRTTQATIDGIYSSGLKTIRIPVSWHNHVNAAFTIDSAWIERVQQVVDWAINAGLYVIINIHHDNSANWYYPDTSHYQKSSLYVSRIWKQIALRFRNYDEHLVFEILNEPRLTGYSNEWSWSDADSILTNSAEITAILTQEAITAIRLTGSNNSQRFIMITPYVASPWAALSSKFTLPSDTASDKLILSVHAYTPYSFAMQDPGISSFNDSGKSEIDAFMSQLDTKFVTGLNIPVVIGEYGATNKNNITDRTEYFRYFVFRAHTYGMCPVLWDNGNYLVTDSSYAEHYGFYNRLDQTWYFNEIINAIVSN